MKRLIKWTIRFLCLMLALGFGLVFFKDSIIQSITENRIRSSTGMTAKIGKLEIGLLYPTITIENLKLYNSAEFGGSHFLDLAELYLEYDPAAIAEKKLHLELVRLDIKEINVVRKPDGVSNLKRLEEILKSSEKNLLTDLEYAGIDTFNLTLEKVSITDMKESGDDDVKAFSIGLKNRVFTDIQTEAQLTSLIFKHLVQQFFKFNLFGGEPESEDSPEN